MALGKRKTRPEGQGEGTPADGAAADRKEGKKKISKWLMIGVPVVVVLAAGAAGGLWWHEQPSFCSALCHSTMTPYYETYQADDMLAGAHAKLGIRCIDCHHATIGDQINELKVQVGGKVESPLSQREFPNEFCSGDDCHGAASLEEVATLTGMLQPNPHDNDVYTVGECTACHNMHAPEGIIWSVDSQCSECHVNQAASLQDSAKLASTHQGQTCVDCHADETLLKTVHASGSDANGEEQEAASGLCLSCHGSYEDLAKKTKDSIALKDIAATIVNPHDVPESPGHDAATGECYNCHSIHGETVDAAAYCFGCHHSGEFVCGGCHE